jgi:hypothetical protein
MVLANPIYTSREFTPGMQGRSVRTPDEHTMCVYVQLHQCNQNAPGTLVCVCMCVCTSFVHAVFRQNKVPMNAIASELGSASTSSNTL